jgi:hypothetical protein
MSKNIQIPSPNGFYIAYKPGRSIAYPQRFESQHKAQHHLEQMGKDVVPSTDFTETMHVIEVTNG